MPNAAVTIKSVALNVSEWGLRLFLTLVFIYAGTELRLLDQPQPSTSFDVTKM